MKYILLIVTWGMINTAWAYGVTTHEDMSENAAKASVLVQDLGVLQDLGIKDIRETFPNSNGSRVDIIELLRNGANFEDTLSAGRASNHFYNPLNGAPLTLGIKLGSPSPDWALEDNGEITGILGFGKQKFSYRDARQYFFDALTKGTKADRDKNFGLTFQTLGMVIHHVQDMAQPQHVRNDQHLELKTSQELALCVAGGGITCAVYFAIKSPSLYEAYTNRDDVRPDLPFSGYVPVYPGKDTNIFNQPRKFWTSTTGAGLAQFTNANFVSAGTNFDNSGMFNFPLFTPSLRTDMDIQQMCANAKPACPNPNLSGKMTFYGNWVEDRFTGSKFLNEYASTRSIFDADLEKINAKKSFSLNRFNFGEMHRFLIPRAVAYSAGLINYFFRGKIDFIKDKNNPGKFVIKNLSAEDMQGTFTLYYDAVDGNRYPVAEDAVDKTWASLAVLKNNQVDNLSFSPPNSPAPKVPGKYILVFNGTLGEEEAIPGVTPGAIAAKEVGQSEPDFYISPSAWESSGRLGRFNSEGNYLDIRNMATRGGFISGLMAYGTDTFHVEAPRDGRLPSFAIKNGVTFQSQVAALNDVAGNGKEIFVVASDGYVDPIVSAYDFEGRFLRSFSILPQYAYQGGFVQLVAYGPVLITTANFTMNLYDTTGLPLLTLDLGQDVFESIVAASRDLIFRANFRESQIHIYGSNGAIKGNVSVPAPAKITCMDATENKLYVVTSDSVGYPPYGGRIHVFSHDAATDKYLLIKETSIPIGLDSWHHACSIDRASDTAH